MRVPTSRARGNGPASTSRPRMVSSLGKQAEDLRGVIHKRVGWVIALIHDPAVTAAVGVNAATNEVLRVAFNDHAFPRRERDIAQVLSPRGMLGKERRPTPEVGGHDDGGAVGPGTHSL